MDLRLTGPRCTHTHREKICLSSPGFETRDGILTSHRRDDRFSLQDHFQIAILAFPLRGISECDHRRTLFGRKDSRLSNGAKRESTPGQAGCSFVGASRANSVVAPSKVVHSTTVETFPRLVRTHICAQLPSGPPIWSAFLSRPLDAFPYRLSPFLVSICRHAILLFVRMLDTLFSTGAYHMI